MNPTPNYHAQDARYAAEARRRSIASQVARDNSDPARIAALAAEHPEHAEALLGLAELRNKPEYAELAQREYQLAYEVEN